MKGTANLFIEQGIASGLAHPVVCAKGKLSNAPGPLVQIEHTEQKVFADGRGSPRHPAMLKTQTNIIDGMTIVAAGESEANASLRAIFHRTGVYLTIRKVDMPITC